MARPASWIAVKLRMSTLPVSGSTLASVKLQENEAPAPWAFRLARPSRGPPVRPAPARLAAALRCRPATAASRRR